MRIVDITRGMQSIVGRAELGLGDKRLRGRGKRGEKGGKIKKGGERAKMIKKGREE